MSERTPGTELIVSRASHYVDVENDADDYVPDHYVGNPILPNKYCRGWNPKPSRQKYCHQLAGHGTDHNGYGRCKHHGGMNPETHGLSRRYEAKTPRMQEILDTLALDTKSNSIDEEIRLLRARLQIYLEDAEEEPDIDILTRLVSEITKAVERDSNMRSKNAITYDQLRKFLFATERVISERIRLAIKDPKAADEVLEKIGTELRGIRP